MLLTTLLTSITLSICILIIGTKVLQYSGYEIHHKSWIKEREKEWTDQIEEDFDLMYTEELERLITDNNNIGIEIDHLKDSIQNSNCTQKHIHLSFSHYFFALVEDSFSIPFEEKFPNGKAVKSFYNKSLLKIIGMVENDFGLYPKENISYSRKKIIQLLEMDENNNENRDNMVLA